MIYIEWIFARTFLYIKANYVNGSFPEGVPLYRFNHIRLPKTEEILKITKLMSCMNFRIMIQAVIKNFGRSTDKRFEENSNDAFCYYLYSIVNKTDMAKLFDQNS